MPNWDNDYLAEKLASCNKEYEYSKMLDQLENTERDFNSIFPRISEHYNDYRPANTITHGEIRTYNGESYIRIDGVRHKLDCDDPESIGKLIIKYIACHLLEES